MRLRAALGICISTLEPILVCERTPDIWGNRVQVAVQAKKNVAYLKGSDVPYDWKEYFKGRVSYPENLEYRDEPYTRIITLLENRIYPFEGMTAEKLASLV